MADDREERIRERAHSIWESEGQPHGRHDEHWHRASAEMGEAGGLAEGAATFDASGRSLGSAAQSDLIPDDAGQGSDRAGSVVDRGPAMGLAAGGLAGGSGGGALGSLSLGQEAGRGDEAAGGMSGIGAVSDEQVVDARDAQAPGEAALGGIATSTQSGAVLGTDFGSGADAGLAAAIEPKVPPRKR